MPSVLFRSIAVALVACLSVAGRSDAQQLADASRRVVLVGVSNPTLGTALNDSALVVTEATLDTLREGRHLQQVRKRDVDRILYTSAFPGWLTSTNDMLLLAKQTGAIAALGVHVERTATGYQLSTTLVPTSPFYATQQLRTISGTSINDVAVSLARLVAADTTIRANR